MTTGLGSRYARRKRVSRVRIEAITSIERQIMFPLSKLIKQDFCRCRVPRGAPGS